MDEIVGNSPKKIVPRMEIYEDDGSWLWVAFAPDCRLIVAFVIGQENNILRMNYLN